MSDMRMAMAALKKDLRIMRTHELPNSRILRQAITAGFLEQKDSGDARSPIQRFKELNCSKWSRYSKPADENGAKSLELLEPVEHLEPSPFNGLNPSTLLRTSSAHPSMNSGCTGEPNRSW